MFRSTINDVKHLEEHEHGEGHGLRVAEEYFTFSFGDCVLLWVVGELLSLVEVLVASLKLPWAYLVIIYLYGLLLMEFVFEQAQGS